MQSLQIQNKFKESDSLKWPESCTPKGLEQIK